MSNYTFSEQPDVNIPRSSFKRSHGIKTSFDAGNLVPFYIDEVLPGDTFNLKANLFGRLATPISPTMDNMYLDTQFFYVPTRLVWENFNKLLGEQKNPGDSTDYLVPEMSSDGLKYLEHTIFDYMGLPTKKTGYKHSSLPLRAYNLIYNEWYRDQNLIDSVPVHKGDADDPVDDYKLLKRCKRHDYFTSCLPFPQKAPAVNLPIGNIAPVISNNVTPKLSANNFTDAGLFASSTTSIPYYTSTSKLYPSGVPGGTWAENTWWGSETGLIADLSNATAATINSLRQAFQVQKLFERDARGGTRHAEILKSHFGVTSPDARLQRPEYLGGSTTRINITPIPQTSETGTTPQGNLGAFGVVSSKQHGFNKSFLEHGFIVGIMSVRADLNYQQGLNKMWSRRTRFDFYWPSFANLGEQAVLNKEIYTTGGSIDDDVFGYQERYAEYRYKPNLITGLFRSNATGSLDSWHLAQDFAATPQLNKEFIEEDVPMDRIVAVPSEPDLIIDGYIDLICARPMPLYSIPGLAGRF